MAPLRRSAPRLLAAGLLALAGALALGGALALAPSPAAAAPASTPVGCDAEARAGGGVGVAVAFPGSVFTACVDPGGSGIDVLRRAGLAPVVQGYGSVGGGAVCALTNPRDGEQVGCAAGPSCLVCQEPRSWSYYQGYRYSSVGAGATRPRAGAIEAWQWGSSRSWAGARAYDLCAPAPPPTTPTTAPPSPTSAPPATGGGSSPDAGGGAPSSGTGSGGSSPDGGSSAPAAPGTTDEPGGSGSAPSTAPTTPPRPSSSSSSTSTSTSTTTTEPTGAVADPDGDRDRPDEADGVVPGDGDEVAQAPPDGTMSVTEDDGGRGVLVPVAGTAGVVGLLSVVAVRARRRRVEGPSAT